MPDELPFESHSGAGVKALHWCSRLERLGVKAVRLRIAGAAQLDIPTAFVEEWLEYRSAKRAAKQRSIALVVALIAAGAVAVLYAFGWLRLD